MLKSDEDVDIGSEGELFGTERQRSAVFVAVVEVNNTFVVEV